MQLHARAIDPRPSTKLFELEEEFMKSRAE